MKKIEQTRTDKCRYEQRRTAINREEQTRKVFKFYENKKKHLRADNNRINRQEHRRKTGINQREGLLQHVLQRVFYSIWSPPISQKKLFFFVWRFQTTSKQKCSNLRPLLSITFPQGFRISKNIGHLTLGSGGKKTFKRYLKSEHSDKQTDTQTDGHFNLQKASAQRANALKTNRNGK